MPSPLLLDRETRFAPGRARWLRRRRGPGPVATRRTFLNLDWRVARAPAVARQFAIRRDAGSPGYGTAGSSAVPALASEGPQRRASGDPACGPPDAVATRLRRGRDLVDSRSRRRRRRSMRFEAPRDHEGVFPRARVRAACSIAGSGPRATPHNGSQREKPVQQRVRCVGLRHAVRYQTQAIPIRAATAAVAGRGFDCTPRSGSAVGAAAIACAPRPELADLVAPAPDRDRVVAIDEIRGTDPGRNRRAHRERSSMVVAQRDRRRGRAPRSRARAAGQKR